MASYRNLDAKALRVVLVHSGKSLLPELHESLGLYTAKKLAARGLDVRLGVRVAGMDETHVKLTDGALLNAHTLVWTAGSAPHPLLKTLPCAEKGRIPVDDCLRVKGVPGVWSLGDCAVVPDVNTGGACPPTAQHASRQGIVLARNLFAALRGGAPRPFRFKTLGQLASLGRRTGVAQILGVRFSGFVAWWLWRTIYLAKLPRVERKVRVALDWTLDLVFQKDLVHLPTELRGSRRVPEAPSPAVHVKSNPAELISVAG
jgi:NADH dehydrogenase